MPGTVAERATEQVTALRAARLERGWSLKQLVRLLWAEADRQEVRIGTHPASVKSLLIAWELGRRTPRAVYVKLLVSLYDTTPAALGLPEPKPPVSMDSAVLAELCANYRGFVRGWIHRRVNDWYLCDDLTSETFIKMGEVLAREPQGWAPENPYPFLAVLARWTISEYYRYQCPKREQFFELDDDFTARDARSRPEETVTETLSILDLLGGLSDTQRELIVLRFFDDLTTAEIQKRMRLSATHTRRLLNQALATMRNNAVVTWDIPATVGALEQAA